eukprot:jgi/Ulvmu1/11358/UM075_0018.1
MEGDGRGSQDRRMSGTPSMPRSGPGMSDSDLGRLNVSLGMLDAGSLLAAQALHGWPGQLQDPSALRALQQNLQQLRQPPESPMHPSAAQFPTSSSLFNTNPYAPASSQPRHTHTLSQYGNQSRKSPPPDLRPPHVQQPHPAPSNPTSASPQAPFGINALGSSLLNLNPLAGLSALQGPSAGGHTDIAALMATPQSGQDLPSQQQFASGFGQHAGGPSPTSQFSPSGQMAGFGPSGGPGGTQGQLRTNPGDLSMAAVAGGPAEQRLSGPGSMAGMLAGSGGSGGAHDFRQQISTGFGAASLGQHGAGPASAGIASLASLLGNIVPTDPRGDGGQGGGVEITAAGPEGAGRGGAGIGLEGVGPAARGGKGGPEGTASKRARHTYRAGAAGGASGAGASEGASEGTGKEKEKDKDDDKALSLVEKRLKQNREAARRSRERKRHLKEELRRRMPVLQKQHDEMAAEVDELMKSMWSNVSKILSVEMQTLMLHQSVYCERCMGLAALMESTDDKALAAGLDGVDAAWADVLASFEGVKSGYGMFMLFNSMNAPPAHQMWYQLGGIKLTYVVRTFLQLPWGTKVLDGETRAALTRLVESWAFHESLLEQGKRLLQQGFLDACITMARLQRQIPQAPVPPNILGHLDTLAVILSNDVGLRKQIMGTLRKMLPLRQMCLLLVVQAALLESQAPVHALAADPGMPMGMGP